MLTPWIEKKYHVAEQRYQYVPRDMWPWLGPAFKGIDADLRTLETGGSGSEPTVADLSTVYNTAKA